MSDRGPRRVVVVGGGVTGLTASFRLTQTDVSPEVVVLEAGDRPGGKLRSTEVGGLTLPAGADSFVARKPWAVDLCKELGLGRRADLARLGRRIPVDRPRARAAA